MLLINSAWILWIALSVFFGYLIADAYFPDNMATFIPFSLIFLVFGGGVAYAVYRIFFKKKGSGGAQNDGSAEGVVVEKSGNCVGVDGMVPQDAIKEDGRGGAEESDKAEIAATEKEADAVEADTLQADGADDISESNGE